MFLGTTRHFGHSQINLYAALRLVDCKCLLALRIALKTGKELVRYSLSCCGALPQATAVRLAVRFSDLCPVVNPCKIIRLLARNATSDIAELSWFRK
jgi:hypothetical protein